MSTQSFPIGFDTHTHKNTYSSYRYCQTVSCLLEPLSYLQLSRLQKIILNSIQYIQLNFLLLKTSETKFFLSIAQSLNCWFGRILRGENMKKSLADFQHLRRRNLRGGKLNNKLHYYFDNIWLWKRGKTQFPWRRNRSTFKILPYQNMYPLTVCVLLSNLYACDAVAFGRHLKICSWEATTCSNENICDRRKINISI